MHTPMACELTAMSVLKGEKRKEEERSTVGVIVGDPMKTSAPCPLAVRAAAETGDGGGVGE